MGYNAGTNALVEGSREDVVVEAMPRTDAAAVMKELFTMNRMMGLQQWTIPFALADCFFHRYRPTKRAAAVWKSLRLSKQM